MADNRYRLLVIDIDGTLLDVSGNISAEDKKALGEVVTSGIPVSLSTGRVVQASLQYIEYLKLEGYHVFFDGALVYSPDRDEEVYVDPITSELVDQMIDYARRMEMGFDMYSATHFYAERETWATDIRREYFKIIPTIVDFRDIWQTERIIKGTLVVSSAEEKAKANDFYLHFRDRLSFSWTKTPAYPEVDFINIIAHGVSKGKALEALVSFLGISMSEVVAIGDGRNDIPLLSAAGLAIAMENAPDELKAVADHVTLDAEHHGVAAAVNKYLL